MKHIDPDKPLPLIEHRQIVAQSRIFKVERVDLRFSNGATRQFERMAGLSHGAVMIVPMLDSETLILVREYAAGTHSYQLGFPKGLIDPGETAIDAANRELQEEAGFAARRFHCLHNVNMAPTFFNSSMTIVVAQDLYPQQLEGDEPEPLDVIHWPLSQADELLQRSDFTEARCIAALLLLQRWLKEKPPSA